MKSNILRFIIFFIVAGCLSLNAQSRLYEGPDDPSGDPAAERETLMDGNRWQLYVNSGGFTGHWGFLDGSKWPRNSERGIDMYDGLSIILGSKVFVENDSIPVTDEEMIATRTDLDTLTIIEADSRSETAPDGTISWALTPVFGYLNELAETPAMSVDPFSWPPLGWPSRGDDLKWPGEWNGRFGRGVMYAQLETYFVMNDAQDQEWLQPEKEARYFPRRQYDGSGQIIKDVKIGDKRPTVTTQKGLPWGGLGLRVETRGYQWDNPQTRDAVFWEYNIANISEYDLPSMVFGYMMDLGIGHYILRSDGEDDVGSFNNDLDLSFCWDTNGEGNFSYPAGTLGFAFLESPGVQSDFIDNDDDGLIDEKRDNYATMQIGPTDGITDMAKFLSFYDIKSVDDLKTHWDADEDQDWKDGEDTNGNGIYDSGEVPGDDIGLDGVAPGDLNYHGPDADGTECNHRPDMLEGVGAEPNFGLTDVSESDMLGLQSFHLFQHPQGGPPSPAHDKECYNVLTDKVLDDFYDKPNNLYQAFGTGPFRLEKGRTERISMATIAAFEDLEILNKEKRAPLIFDRKKVVQIIYESDYRFARPPEMPTLKAVAADGKVILTWDDRADRLTREPLAGGENDFEGYRLYRSTDRFFEDALLLRDGFGNPAGLKPLKQWDLKNDYFGFTDFALVEGEGVFLGNNTGIQHYYIDTAVQNGRTYYYYLAAYDHGLRDKSIAPAENVPTVVVDEAENITFMSPNVQVATPKPTASGFAETNVTVLHDADKISGPVEQFSVSIVDPTALKQDHIYQVVFDVDTVKTFGKKPEQTLWGYYFVNIGYRIYDETTDSLLFYENKSKFIQNHVVKFATGGTNYGDIISWDLLATDRIIESDIFDGLQASFSLPFGEEGLAYWDSLSTGWFSGGGNINVSVYKGNLQAFPYVFDLVFTGEDELYTSRLEQRLRVNTGTGLQMKAAQYLLGESFPFYVEDKSHFDENGQFLKLDLVAIDMNGNGQFDLMEDEIFVAYLDYDSKKAKTSWVYSLFSFNFLGSMEGELPAPGSVYRIPSVTPFTQSDTLRFQVPQYSLNAGPLVEEQMDKIKVVPNPYVVTNFLEPSVRNNQLNQRRRIMFTHIPAQCTIKIFTMSGYLVDVIEVDGPQDNGMAYWDLLTKENLEIAAGVYLYHVKSGSSGKEKTGKFAVIK